MAGKNLKSYDDQINPEGVGRVVRSTDDSDVEGHGFGTRGR